ncbi:uncharacterized protein KGF55_004353 [Candida pseudojiufengensis]|uniref:uncharacterized protein n=1 Tax=Candida pseudojiufengensis TaxID=497109 RepID=UPI00222503B5|nr:uncharacterized protein KGF55_004353 [Candida pseudojiufengensis]KAI5960783.1 hypothetical protein KGF55_004353 [Candida pseudojiufengensis]
MSIAQPPTPQVIVSQLEEAKKLTVSKPEIFTKIYKQILPIINNNQSNLIKKWGIDFIHGTLITGQNGGNLTINDKVDLAIDSLDTLIFLMNIPINIQQQQQITNNLDHQQGHDVISFKNLIDISLVVYKLVFKYIAENDGSVQLWTKLTELKNSLVNKFNTNYPLENSDNVEHDLIRNIATKLELLKFLMTVIDYQSKTQIVGEPIENPGFSLSNVPANHTLISYQNMEYESSALFNNLILKVFSLDIMIPQLISATLNHCVIVLKKKPQLAPSLLKAVESYDSETKLQSNYQSLEQFRLSKKYVDRSIRIFLSHAKRCGLVPNQFKDSIDAKIAYLTDQGNEIKKKNLFTLDLPRPNKRKFEGFYNPSKKIKSLDYKSLYTLLDPSNGLNQFDFKTIPPQFYSKMVINALKKASVPKLTKALEIVGERYKDALSNPQVPNKKLKSESGTPAFDNLKNEANVKTEPGIDSNQDLKIKKEEDEDDEDQDGDDEDAEDVEEPFFTLPPAKDLSFEEKKEHFKIIIDNFFKLAKLDLPANTNPVQIKQAITKTSNGTDVTKNKDQFSNELTDIAIKSFKKDTWVLLLTRLATRGMRTNAEEDEIEDKSPDDQANEDLSNMIRDSLFNYFIENIHSRVDVVIEWLNEEWFSEQAFQQDRILSKSDNSETQPNSKILFQDVKTPVYYKWANKVLEAMINYLEANDRKIFLRLLSDLPILNEEMLQKIKNLCFDPERSSMGFLAFQFLIMYRPPVKEICINILKELSESDQDDVKEEAKKKLAKV